MDVRIEKIGEKEKEQVLIQCRSVTEEVEEIAAFVKSRQGSLTGVLEGRRFEVAVSDICYIESVDGNTFLYTKEKVYETSSRLYELEEKLRTRHFLRISKSMLISLLKIQSIRPAMGGRFTALLYSGEQIIISRNYVKALKAALKGE